MLLNFNPRSHKGSDDSLRLRSAQSARFQSTLPQGERLAFRVAFSRFYYFNPRSHKGSDINHVVIIRTFDISIHAPTRGATARQGTYAMHTAFQSTLPQGERQEGKPVGVEEAVFQSTLPQGERLQCNDKAIDIRKFQSTLPQGERLDCPFGFRYG